MFPGKWYDEIRVGERFGTSLTVTETHLVLGSGLFGDSNPLHVDEEFSRQSIFGGRILHGPFTSALISAPVGAVRPGDTLSTEWTVTGTARNQAGELAVEADGKILVSSRPSR